MTARHRKDSRRVAVNARLDREVREEQEARRELLAPLVDKATEGDRSALELLAREDRRSRDSLIGRLLDKAHDLKGEGEKERASLCFDTAVELARVA